MASSDLTRSNSMKIPLRGEVTVTEGPAFA